MVIVTFEHVYVSLCVCMRLTVCRVAVESLAGRRAVEVGVPQQSSLARRVAQTILCLYVCTLTDMRERHRGEKERDGERDL